MIDLFEDFVWPLPTAFDTVMKWCEFHEGDVFYDTVKAYTPEGGTWIDVCQFATYIMQIRSVQSVLPEDVHFPDRYKFRRNWPCRVSLQLTYVPSMEQLSARTTAGRLYTTIKEGDISLLSMSLPAGVLGERKKVKEYKLVSTRDRQERPGEKLLGRIIYKGSQSAYELGLYELSTGAFRFTCSCMAGKMGLQCKHRIAILAGEHYRVPVPERANAARMVELLAGSDIERCFRAWKRSRFNDKILKEAFVASLGGGVCGP